MNGRFSGRGVEVAGDDGEIGRDGGTLALGEGGESFRRPLTGFLGKRQVEGVDFQLAERGFGDHAQDEARGDAVQKIGAVLREILPGGMHEGPARDHGQAFAPAERARCRSELGVGQAHLVGQVVGLRPIAAGLHFLKYDQVRVFQSACEGPFAPPPEWYWAPDILSGDYDGHIVDASLAEDICAGV